MSRTIHDSPLTSGLPLDGIVVLDLTRALAGPFCTALLGDLGADVIKVEGLPDGDATRAWPPFDRDQSLYYLSANRNKRSIALDLRSAGGRAVLADLVGQSDVLVENFRPGVLARLGLDSAVLRVERPELVLCSISGFGEVGPLRDAAGLDQIAQGMSGLMSVTGAGDHTPMRVGIPIIDTVTGLCAAIGALASLVARGRAGLASRVSTSLLESAVAVMTFQAQRFLSAGEVALPQGNDHPLIAPYGTFRTADTPINLAVGNDAQWRLLCDALAAPDLAADPRFATAALRSANRVPLSARLDLLISSHPGAELIHRLQVAGIPAGPIHDMGQVFSDPQVRALGMVQHVATSGGGGDVPLVRGPLTFDSAPTPIRSAPPRLGQHTVPILQALGYPAARIDELLGSGAARGSSE